MKGTCGQRAAWSRRGNTGPGPQKEAEPEWRRPTAVSSVPRDPKGERVGGRAGIRAGASQNTSTQRVRGTKAVREEPAVRNGRRGLSRWKEIFQEGGDEIADAVAT